MYLFYFSFIHVIDEIIHIQDGFHTHGCVFFFICLLLLIFKKNFVCGCAALFCNCLGVVWCCAYVILLRLYKCAKTKNDHNDNEKNKIKNKNKQIHTTIKTCVYFMLCFVIFFFLPLMCICFILLIDKFLILNCYSSNL